MKKAYSTMHIIHKKPGACQHVRIAKVFHKVYDYFSVACLLFNNDASGPRGLINRFPQSSRHTACVRRHSLNLSDLHHPPGWMNLHRTPTLPRAQRS